MERFLSVIHHICNRHEFPGNKYYHKCEHDPYTIEETKEREWLKMGSPPHEALKKVILQSELVKDMKKMSENASTSALEIFHALKIRYLPKSIFFEKEKMIAGTALAVMDHNFNTKREQVNRFIALLVNTAFFTTEYVPTCRAYIWRLQTPVQRSK